MTELVVLKAGISTTVQDRGRVGYLACGVPKSGALDPVMLAVVNAVVGNSAGEAALEMLYSGVLIAARGGSLRVALGGAGAMIETSTETRPLLPWQSAVLADGERLRVGPIRESAAAYLAVEGGFAIAPVLGSRSTYLRGRLGGWHGRALKAGDALPLVEPHASARGERKLSRAPDLRAPAVLRVEIGPHADRFARTSLAEFLRSIYTVTPHSDRSGLRLEGARLQHENGYELASEGMPPGSIQVPGAGQPVVLIGDHPTVGGYPRIATIISADVPAAGRLRIGASVRFAAVDRQGAHSARLAHESEIADYVRRVEAAT